MRIPRLYVEQPLAIGVPLQLDPHSARYLRSVLRLSEGDSVVVFDGRGGEYRAVLETSGKASARIIAKEFDPVERESPLHIHLAIGISRGERMDLVVQKATELGIAEITPLFTQRCEVKLSQARTIKKKPTLAADRDQRLSAVSTQPTPRRASSGNYRRVAVLFTIWLKIVARSSRRTRDRATYADR